MFKKLSFLRKASHALTTVNLGWLLWTLDNSYIAWLNFVLVLIGVKWSAWGYIYGNKRSIFLFEIKWVIPDSNHDACCWGRWEGWSSTRLTAGWAGAWSSISNVVVHIVSFHDWREAEGIQFSNRFTESWVHTCAISLWKIVSPAWNSELTVNSPIFSYRTKWGTWRVISSRSSSIGFAVSVGHNCIGESICIGGN